MCEQLFACINVALTCVCVIAAPESKKTFSYWFKKATCATSGVPTLNYETDLLDSTIRRIIGLLQVGFGEAGAAIIAQNMKVCRGARMLCLSVPVIRAAAAACIVILEFVASTTVCSL